jgi:hypothetical protein
MCPPAVSGEPVFSSLASPGQPVMTAGDGRDPFAVDDVRALDALRLAWGGEYDEIWVHGGEWCAHHKDGHDENVLT